MMSKQKTVYVFTQAYNAEKTLSRTIESVLGQVYSNVIYYVADSASTDNTKNIITSYAMRDGRVKPIFLTENLNWEMYNIIPEILKTDKTGYFVQIDADDEYKTDFINKMIDFINDSKLDVAACASAYIDGVTLENKSKLILEDNILIEGNQFQTLFGDYFRYFRDSWGKVFSLSLFEKVNFDRLDKSIMNGSVSYLSFEALLNAKKIGVYKEALHNYYVYPDSFERNKNSCYRILTPTLYFYYYQYLLNKCGEISKKNEEFLINSYCNAICGKIINFDVPSLSIEEQERIFKILTENEFMTIIKKYEDKKYLERIKKAISVFDGLEL